MSEQVIKVPGSTAFRLVTLLLHVSVLAGIFWVQLNTKAELKNYVSQQEFQTYKEDHDKWAKEVVRRLDENHAEWKRQLSDLQGKIDRLIERR